MSRSGHRSQTPETQSCGCPAGRLLLLCQLVYCSPRRHRAPDNLPLEMGGASTCWLNTAINAQVCRGLSWEQVKNFLPSSRFIACVIVWTSKEFSDSAVRPREVLKVLPQLYFCIKVNERALQWDFVSTWMRCVRDFSCESLSMKLQRNTTHACCFVLQGWMRRHSFAANELMLQRDNGTRHHVSWIQRQFLEAEKPAEHRQTDACYRLFQFLPITRSITQSATIKQVVPAAEATTVVRTGLFSGEKRQKEGTKWVWTDYYYWKRNKCVFQD